MLNGRDALLIDVDHEMAMTRRVLERIPLEPWTWAPHAKSFTLGGLATHLSQLPLWGLSILNREFHDLAAGGARNAAAASLAEVLGAFDQRVSDLRRRVLEMSEAELMAPWSLRRGDQTLLTMPRVMAIRRYVVHHAIHHRGQLTVYLRMHDVPLPPLYGPTADEGM